MYMYVYNFNSFPNVTVTPLPSWEKVASPAVFARLVREGEEGDRARHFPSGSSLFQCLSPLRANERRKKKRNVLPIYSVSVLIT